MVKQFNGIEIHPAAMLFPMMSASDYERFRDDIKQNGQNEPVVFYDGMLIDGRNRYKACLELGIEVDETELDKDLVPDPVEWVLSTNLHRRHLHPSQRAMIAAKMATLKRGRPSSNGNGQNCPLTGNDDAAKLLSVSPRSVKAAKHVCEHGSKDLIEAVEACEITVSMAEKLCKSCDDKREQTRLVKDGKKAIKEYLNPTPHDTIPPLEEQTDGEIADKYEYQVVKMFRHADYRLNTLMMLAKELTEHEREVLKDWLTTPPPSS